MQKKSLFYYGINLIVTVFLALLFGGVLGAMGGNELFSGLIITMGVQLAPLISFCIYKKKYNPEKHYTCDFNIWSLTAIKIPVVLIVSSSLILSLTDVKFIPTEYKGFLFAAAIITTAIGCTAEELGWRGCLLPIFEEKHSKLTSALYTGLLWGAWHFFKISSIGITGYFLFIPSIIVFSIIMSYIFNKSNRSIVNMSIFHCFINFSTIIMLYERECIQFYIILFIISLIFLAILYIKDYSFWRKEML